MLWGSLMNCKNYALFLLLLTPQLGAMPRAISFFDAHADYKKHRVPEKVSVRVEQSVSSAPSPTKLSRATRAKGWLSVKYANAKSSVSRLVQSAWKKAKSTTSSVTDSASKRVTGIWKTYPKVCATAGGVLSYLVLKPCVEQYIQWHSEDKAVITGSMCALVGASILGLGYLGKLPRIQSGVVASFFAGMIGAGLTDHISTECLKDEDCL
jgi:hypothetical protein